MPALLGLAETSRQHNGLGFPASSAIDATSSSRLKHPAELSALENHISSGAFHCRPTDHGERLRFSPIASYRKRSPASVSRVMSRDGHATAPMTRAKATLLRPAKGRFCLFLVDYLPRTGRSVVCGPSKFFEGSAAADFACFNPKHDEMHPSPSCEGCAAGFFAGL